MATDPSASYSKMDLLVEDFTGTVVAEKNVSMKKAAVTIEKFVELHQPGKNGLGAKEHERLCHLLQALKGTE